MIRLLTCSLALTACLFVMASAGAAPAPSPASQPTVTTAAAAGGKQNVEIDWLAECLKGGWTMVALAALSVAGLAFIIERLVTVRRARFAPAALAGKLAPLLKQGAFEQAMKVSRQYPSALGRVAEAMVLHRGEGRADVSAAAADVGAREISNQFQRNAPLAVIAGLAPLLGLLGTMIGMIEAFQLVAIYGDEGGASMLADSIAKALITTAAGLVIAIPALAAYHFFKARVHGLAHEVEERAESLLLALPASREVAATHLHAHPVEDAPARYADPVAAH